MNEIARRVQFPAPPDIADLIDPFQLLFNWRAPTQPFGIRIETRLEDGAYVVRGELPGIDPDKDVEVTVAEGVLTIHAERAEQCVERHHSEFRYGSHTRSLRLPEGAKPDEITATYRSGILTIRIGMDQAAKPASRRIKVENAE